MSDPERLFPIQRQPGAKAHRLRIPWSVAEKAYTVYSTKYGTGQSLERMAERGGFCPDEMDDFHPAWRDESDEIFTLKAKIAELESALSAPRTPTSQEKLDAITIDREHREAAIQHGTASPDLAPRTPTDPTPALELSERAEAWLNRTMLAHTGWENEAQPAIERCVRRIIGSTSGRHTVSAFIELIEALAAPLSSRRTPEPGPAGVYICDKCGFELTRMILRASDGAVGVDADQHDEPCPNDGTPLRTLTWKEDAERANRVGLEQMRRADALQDQITAIQQVAAVHTGVLSNQIFRLCEEPAAPSSPSGAKGTTTF